MDISFSDADREFQSEVRTWLEDASAALFDIIGDGRVNIAVNQTFPLAEAGRAHDALEGRETTGCTVLIP